jgi:hypothetical protein
MGYDDHAPSKQAQGDKPFLSIVEAAILESDAGSGKHLFGVVEIQAMLGEVAAVLRLVPLVSHPTL